LFKSLQTDDRESVTWFLGAAGPAISEENKRKARNSSARMKRFGWREFVKRKSDKKFKRYFRFTKMRLRCTSDQEELKPLSSNRPDAISIEIQLAITVRYLAGGALLDLEEIFKVCCNSTMYCIIPRYEF
jgi:hypothetical protein